MAPANDPSQAPVPAAANAPMGPVIAPIAPAATSGNGYSRRSPSRAVGTRRFVVGIASVVHVVLALWVVVKYADVSGCNTGCHHRCYGIRAILRFKSTCNDSLQRISLTRENLGTWARAVGSTSWAPVAIILAYTPACFVLFPRPVLTLLTVIAFGAVLGFFYSALGILLAALFTYYAGRLMRPETVRRIAGERIDEVRGVLKEHGVLAIFAANMVPIPPFAVQGIVAGAIRMNAWQHLIGSILGMAPGLLAGGIDDKLPVKPEPKYVGDGPPSRQ